MRDYYRQIKDYMADLYKSMMGEGYIPTKQLRRLEQLVKKAEQEALIESTLRIIDKK